jgi:hypothetical protein
MSVDPAEPFARQLASVPRNDMTAGGVGPSVAAAKEV